MATNVLLPIFSACTKEEQSKQSIQATVVFCNNPSDGASKVFPIYLFAASGAEVILGLVDGVAGAVDAFGRLRSGSAKGLKELREAFCLAALAHTHSNESLLKSPISDPLELILDIYGPVGDGVYVFDSAGRLAARRSVLSEYDAAPAGDTEFLAIRTHAGLADRFLSVREDACRAEVDALSEGCRVTAASRQRLISVLNDSRTLSPASMSFPSFEALARVETQMRRSLKGLRPIKAANGIGDVRVAGSHGTVSAEW
jgi:hypothetical protein